MIHDIAQVDEIIQIKPDCPNDIFRCCLATVREVNDHRVMAYVTVPSDGPQTAFVFIRHGDYVRTYTKAIYVVGRDEDEQEGGE